LHVSDRIHIRWNGDEEIVRAFDSGSEQIAQEVLALNISRDENLALPSSETSDDQLPIAIKIMKA
jgi:hypothetical protein